MPKPLKKFKVKPPVIEAIKIESPADTDGLPVTWHDAQRFTVDRPLSDAVRVHGRVGWYLVKDGASYRVVPGGQFERAFEAE